MNCFKIADLGSGSFFNINLHQDFPPSTLIEAYVRALDNIHTLTVWIHNYLPRLFRLGRVGCFFIRFGLFKHLFGVFHDLLHLTAG